MAPNNILVVDKKDRLRVLVHEVGDLKSAVRLLEKRVAQLEDRLPDGWNGDAQCGVAQNGVGQNGVVQNGVVQNGAELSPPMDLASVEKSHILRVLQYTGGNKVEAARLLNIGLTTVYRKMEAYGLD